MAGRIRPLLSQVISSEVLRFPIAPAESSSVHPILRGLGSWETMGLGFLATGNTNCSQKTDLQRQPSSPNLLSHYRNLFQC